MISLFILKGKDREELASIIAPIVEHPEFEKLKSFKHHLFFNRYEHLLHTASLCLRVGKLLRADVKTCVLSGLLHDFHYTYDKSYTHGIIAAEKARKFGVHSEAIKIIEAHMFPLGFGKIQVPWNREFLTLKFCDAFAAIVEVCFGLITFSFEHATIKFKETQEVLANIKALSETRIRAMEAELKQSLHCDISEIKQSLKTDISGIKASIKTDISEMTESIKTDISATISEIKEVTSLVQEKANTLRNTTIMQPIVSEECSTL